MPISRKATINLTPAAEVALSNIIERAYGAMSEDFAVSHALVMLWRVMELEGAGAELRTRQGGSKGRTRAFKVDSADVPERYRRT